MFLFIFFVFFLFLYFSQTTRNNVYQFSPGTPASSTTKTGRHDIAEILLKLALKHQKIKKK